MAGELASWLSGPEAVDTGQYPGERLGMPRDGSGSLVGFGRRLLALTVDYFIAVGLTAMAVPLGWLTQEEFWYSPSARLWILAVWVLLGVVAVRLYSFTPGQFVCGLRVVSVDRRRHVGLGRAIGRGLLIAMVIPALFTDGDGRGLQDRVTRTAVVRR